LALEPYVDKIDSPEAAKVIKALANSHREGERLKKEREAATAEAKKQADAEREKYEAQLREKQENDLRAMIRQANPGISASEVEALLPEMRAEMQKQKTKAAIINRERGRGFRF
jgi:hypothetical protein